MFYETVEGDQLASPPLEIDADSDEPDIEIGESGGDEAVKDDDNEEEEQEEQDESEEELDAEETAPPMQTRSAKKAASRGTTRSGTQLAPDPESAGLLTIEDIETLNLLQELKNIEFGCVGAGLGGGFQDTHELHVMKYDEAMNSPDREHWNKAVEEEHNRMKKHTMFEPVLISELPPGTNVIDSTWAMKKKANGAYRGRVAARGFKQKDGVDYFSHSISAPVTTNVTIRIILVLMLMAGWCAQMLDVNGAFLHGDFTDGEKVHMKVPQGFERWYDPRLYVLLLLQTLYGCKQSAMAFWRKILQCFDDMGFKRSKADPCLYFKWTLFGLVIWLSWIDDCLCVGSKQGVMKAKQQMKDQFDCDDVGDLNEYIGCKVEIDHENGTVKFTQPVMLQSFKDEFELDETFIPSTPMDAGKILTPSENESKNQTPYQSGVGKLLHMMQWSRPDILNATRELFEMHEQIR